MQDRKDFLKLARSLENELKEIYEVKKHQADINFTDTITKYLKEIKALQLKIQTDIEQSE